MKRKMKVELTIAIVAAVVLALLSAYAELSARQGAGVHLYIQSRPSDFASTYGLRDPSADSTQQVISENIQGEVRKGEFEATVQGVKDSTSEYGGRVRALVMRYESEHWSGTMDCKVPTDNVTSFTFEIRKLVNDHGKVTQISIDVKEVEINQTQALETPLSDISIYLYEPFEDTLPFLKQLGAVLPVLTTALVWIVEGVVIGVPLCFAALGVVKLVDRGIIPIWKKQFGNRNPGKERTQNINS